MLTNQLEVSMYRYNPEQDEFPYMKKYKIEKPARDIMVLDLLHLLKEEDESQRSDFIFNYLKNTF